MRIHGSISHKRLRSTDRVQLVRGMEGISRSHKEWWLRVMFILGIVWWRRLCRDREPILFHSNMANYSIQPISFLRMRCAASQMPNDSDLQFSVLALDHERTKMWNKALSRNDNKGNGAEFSGECILKLDRVAFTRLGFRCDLFSELQRIVVDVSSECYTIDRQMHRWASPFLACFNFNFKTKLKCISIARSAHSDVRAEWMRNLWQVIRCVNVPQAHISTLELSSKFADLLFHVPIAVSANASCI